MATFTTNKFGKVKFFRNEVATPAFLEEHEVSYIRNSEYSDVIICRSQDESNRLYLVDIWQLRAANTQTMDKRYAGIYALPEAQRPAAIDLIGAEQPYEKLGEQLYFCRAPDEGPQRVSLPNAAQAAAVAAGVRPTAAQWFSSFVEDAFFGFASWQEFTYDGIRRPPRSFGAPLALIKRQLDQLQRRDIMRYELLARDAGVYLRFNRQFLPGLDFGKLPLFFDTFLY